MKSQGSFINSFLGSGLSYSSVVAAERDQPKVYSQFIVHSIHIIRNTDRFSATNEDVAQPIQFEK
jgi:hypothetical protein